MAKKDTKKKEVKKEVKKETPVAYASGVPSGLRVDAPKVDIELK